VRERIREHDSRAVTLGRRSASTFRARRCLEGGLATWHGARPRCSPWSCPPFRSARRLGAFYGRSRLACAHIDEFPDGELVELSLDLEAGRTVYVFVEASWVNGGEYVLSVDEPD
jgi:hypothetical protein